MRRKKRPFPETLLFAGNDIPSAQTYPKQQYVLTKVLQPVLYNRIRSETLLRKRYSKERMK